MIIDLDVFSFSLLALIYIKEKEKAKEGQELIHSSTRPDPGHHMGLKLNKEGWQELAYPYNKLFTVPIRLQTFPNPYKMPNVPIHKKYSKMNPKSYRPVSLNSI